MTRGILLRLAAFAAALAGYWLPWVAHRAAGLAIAAVDLPEFPKFMPQVRSGELEVWRDAFYMPLAALALCLALWMAAPRAVPPNLRWLLRGIAIGLPLMPSVFNVLEAGELQTQLRLAGGVSIVVCLSAFWRRLPQAPRAATLAGVFVFGALAPTWQFIRMKPALDSIYGSTVDVGPGLWVTLAAFGALALLEAVEARFSITLPSLRTK